MTRKIAWSVGLLIGIALAWHALPAVERSLHTRPGDGAVDWLGARAWLARVNVYSPEGLRAYGLERYGFAHPPTAPFWLLPYAHWDVDGLGTMMGWTTVLLLAVHCAWAARTLSLPIPFALVSVGLVLHASFLHNDLTHAQVSELIAFVYLLAWLALRRDHELLCGLAIGLACTFKPFAGVLWIFLVVSGRWRGAVAAIVAWLAVAVTMTSRFGLGAWAQWNVFNRATAEVWLWNMHNATVYGIVMHIAHPVCQHHRYGPSLGLTIIAGVIGIAILGVCFWLSRRAPHQPDLVFAAWSTASVFVNPVAWEHYAFILVVPIFVLVHESLQRRGGTRIVGLAGALASAALLGIDMESKQLALKLVYLGPWPHVRYHLYEVANWLPWLIVLVTAWVLLASSEGARPAPTDRTSPRSEPAR